MMSVDTGISSSIGTSTTMESKEDWRKVERNMRYHAVDFLQHAGELLKIPQTTIAIGIIYYHKFYQFIRDEQIATNKYDKYHVACACLFIACKCQECLRSLRDICNVLHRIRNPQKPLLALNDHELAKLKQSIALHEQIVLRALAFNVRITVPYSYVGPYLKCLNFAGPKSEDPTRDHQLRQLLQCTCSLLNDSLRTDLCITHKPHEIAVGCIHLAARLCNIELPYRSSKDAAVSIEHNISREWYNVFNVSKDTLQKISNEMILMYTDYKQTKQ